MHKARVFVDDEAHVPKVLVNRPPNKKRMMQYYVTVRSERQNCSAELIT
jgi:hypothetical protein